MKTLINNFLISFIIIFSASGLSNAQYLSKTKLQSNTNFFADTTKKKIKLTEKSPVLAGTLSFMVPGFALGQLYNKQPGKFFVHICITGVSLLGAVLGVTNLDIDVGGSHHGSGRGAWLFLFSAAIFAGNWIWSVADAVISANKINEQTELNKSRSEILNKIKFGFTLDKNKAHNLKFALEL